MTSQGRRSILSERGPCRRRLVITVVILSGFVSTLSAQNRINAAVTVAEALGATVPRPFAPDAKPTPVEVRGVTGRIYDVADARRSSLSPGLPGGRRLGPCRSDGVHPGTRPLLGAVHRGRPGAVRRLGRGSPRPTRPSDHRGRILVRRLLRFGRFRRGEDGREALPDCHLRRLLPVGGPDPGDQHGGVCSRRPRHPFGGTSPGQRGADRPHRRTTPCRAARSGARCPRRPGRPRRAC